jgi:hypothetical protein
MTLTIEPQRRQPDDDYEDNEADVDPGQILSEARRKQEQAIRRRREEIFPLLQAIRKYWS